MLTLKKIKLKRSVYIVVAVVIALPVTVWGALFVNCQIGNQNLDKEVQKKVEALNKITVIDGQKTQASGQRNGNCHTGKASDQHASATFKVDGTLASKDSLVGYNLSKAGYSKKSDKYSAHGNLPSEIQWISTKLSNSKKEPIAVTYAMDNKFMCPNNQECASKPGQDGLSSFSAKPLYFESIHEIKVTL